MAPDVGLLRGPAPLRSPAPPRAVPVLIQVPALSASARLRVPLAPARRRRRLRREVRLGGLALLVGLPVAGLFLDPASLAPSGLMPALGQAVRGAGAAGVTAADPPTVSLSLDLQPVPPAAEAEDPDVPVVRPSGYLLPELPDDGVEETAHAGS